MKLCGLCFTEPCRCVPDHKARFAARCREHADKLIDPLRAGAHLLGYALLVHGSLARDIDLVAVPWVDGAVSAQELVDGLVELVKFHNGGFAHVQNNNMGDGTTPTEKPHGRLAWSIHLGGGPWIDLSVMPRRSA